MACRPAGQSAGRTVDFWKRSLSLTASPAATDWWHTMRVGFPAESQKHRYIHNQATNQVCWWCWCDMMLAGVACASKLIINHVTKCQWLDFYALFFLSTEGGIQNQFACTIHTGICTIICWSLAHTQTHSAMARDYRIIKRFVVGGGVRSVSCSCMHECPYLMDGVACMRKVCVWLNGWQTTSISGYLLGLLLHLSIDGRTLYPSTM